LQGTGTRGAGSSRTSGRIGVPAAGWKRPQREGAGQGTATPVPCRGATVPCSARGPARCGADAFQLDSMGWLRSRSWRKIWVRPFLDKKSPCIISGIAKFLVVRRKKKNEKSQIHFSALKIKLLFQYSWEFHVRNIKLFFRKCHVQRKYLILSKTRFLSVKIFPSCTALQYPKIVLTNEEQDRIFPKHC